MRNPLAASVLILFLGLLGRTARGGEIHFRTDVLPVLSKAGCNSGACHGAATGQGGFRLSLLGYDPEQDYWNITRELGGRRASVDDPGSSLILRKPTNEIDHDGGRKIRKGSSEYQTVLEWLEKGARYGNREMQVSEITVAPQESLVTGTNLTVAIQVTASHSDGSRREVTGLALYTSNDEAVAEVDREGVVVTRGPGLTSIMVRYGGRVAAVRIAVPYGSAEDLPELPIYNLIDGHISKELKRLGIAASPVSADAEFCRRVHLDLTGRLPEAPEVTTFLAQARTRAERESVIERLLQTEGFTDYWTLKLADLLLISGKRGMEKSALVYHDWLRDEVARNTSWAEIARDLVTATGDITMNGPANFYTLANDPRDLGEHVSRIFLGTQLACARCHAHPTDRWTQQDYYDFAAFFAQISRTGSLIEESGHGDIRYPKDGSPALPRPPGGKLPTAAPETDPRKALAEWMTRRENPFFARAMVNRVWKELLGRGLIEPVDDLRPTNPASHPELLDVLAKKFADNNFDLRWLVRTIANSATYQLSSRKVPGNEQDERLFSRAYLKPLPAQVLVDAISQVTGVAEQFEGVPAGTRAVQLPTPQSESYALDVLGRCGREQNCETGSSAGGGMAAALHLINGTTVNSKLTGGIIRKMIGEGSHLPKVISALYLRSLSRHPSPAELEFWKSTMQETGDLQQGYEDLLWTLLNCREFAFNH